jgi:hypothetical protein
VSGADAGRPPDHHLSPYERQSEDVGAFSAAGGFAPGAVIKPDPEES